MKKSSQAQIAMILRQADEARRQRRSVARPASGTPPYVQNTRPDRRSIYAASVCGIAGWAATRTGLPFEVAHVIGRRMSSAFDLSGGLKPIALLSAAEATDNAQLIDKYANVRFNRAY
ncbi:hypothetical protein [Chelativorans salis]|uniref:Uncharacterized protein n=1 Tax=Chelativorans salis TaxID=2978478 RepID=A0ABT2LUV4_9HYPH|nr:hypothetical protein [Chelativorans sp. EGI FJ00035]MCT7378166.1 hypothetical protein [Chelativorans sp. EGI FJ00035]